MHPDFFLYIVIMSQHLRPDLELGKLILIDNDTNSNNKENMQQIYFVIL